MIVERGGRFRVVPDVAWLVISTPRVDAVVPPCTSTRGWVAVSLAESCTLTIGVVIAACPNVRGGGANSKGEDHKSTPETDAAFSHAFFLKVLSNDERSSCRQRLRKIESSSSKSGEEQHEACELCPLGKVHPSWELIMRFARVRVKTE